MRNTAFPLDDMLTRQRCWSSRRRTDRPRTVARVSQAFRREWCGICGGGTNLSDILVPHTADLLDVGGALGDLLEVVAGELELVLDVLRGLDVDAGGHGDPADELLAQEVAGYQSARCPQLPLPLSQASTYRISTS